MKVERYQASISIVDPGSYYRQYVGVVVAHHRLVYVNAMCRKPTMDWRRHFVIVDDGWTCFWGVLYNPETGQFSDLEINSRA